MKSNTQLKIWEDELLDKYKECVKTKIIILSWRIKCNSFKQRDSEVDSKYHWLTRVGPIPHDEVRVWFTYFETPKELEKQIVEKNDNENIGLSRIVATFDWEYSGNKKEDSCGMFLLEIGKCHGTYNYLS